MNPLYSQTLDLLNFPMQCKCLCFSTGSGDVTFIRTVLLNSVVSWIFQFSKFGCLYFLASHERFNSYSNLSVIRYNTASSGGSDGKESACNAGDPGLTPALGRSPGVGNGNPLQYSCLENLMDRRACWATVWLPKSQTWLSNFRWNDFSFPCFSISIIDREERKHTFVYVGFVHVICSCLCLAYPTLWDSHGL